MYRIISFAILILMTVPSTGMAALKVVVTVPDLGAIAKTVGGEDVEVTTLARSRENPHYVDPKPSFLVSLRQADLLIINGMDLESSWLGGLLTNARNSDILFGSPGHLDASVVVRRKEVGATDRSQGDVHPAGNPHYTYDPREVLAVTALIANRMAQLDPANRDDYIRRAKAFRQSLFLFAKQERERFSKLSASQRQIASYHRSLVYFADWLRLDIIAEVEPKPGIPPSPSHIGRVISMLKSRNAKAILSEPWYSTKTVQNIGKLTTANVVYIGPCDGSDYLGNLRTIVNGLYDVIK